MLAVAETTEKTPSLSIRRFQIPDLNTHGAWLVPRLEQAFGLNERQSASWLRTLIYSNDSLFLFHPDAVALAQTDTTNTLQPKPVVRERFVWCRDREDKEQQKEAARFYAMFVDWAKHQGAEIMLVGEMTDVPNESMKVHTGRIFMRQQQFVRI